MRKDGKQHPVLKVLGAKVDRKTHKIKYNCLFSNNQNEWILAPHVNKHTEKLAKQTHFPSFN